jgi:carboxymethylenebutenolidase
MGQIITLTTSDGFALSAYRVEPAGTPRGGIVVLQEIFGVNHHIRAVADRYAEQGYLAVAPALFDRVQPGVELGYTPDGIQQGIELNKKTRREDTLKDIAAAVAEAARAGKVGVVGYCWGGSLAYASAASLDGIAAAVGYYGGMIAGMLDQKPKVPTILHFGAKDAHIPLSDVEKIKAALPSVPVYVYDADHGFNCDERGSYNTPSADLALGRTLPFFREHVG